MTAADFIGYVIAQFAGSTIGAAALMAFVGKDSGLGANALYDDAVSYTHLTLPTICSV